MTRLYQSLFLTALSKTRRGCLNVTLPDGSKHIFGTPGAEVTADLTILRPVFFKRSVLFGDIGFAESYLDGDWETSSLERVISWAILNVESPPLEGEPKRSPVFNFLQLINRVGHLLRPNSIQTSRRNISEHYDLGNSFYQLWLDPSMTYSSALFTSREQSLEAAQAAKYDRLCRQLRLSPTDHVLEIGCGWGGFSAHAAKHYGCRIRAITISAEQHKFARERMAREGLSGLVDVLLEDYRKVAGTFDKIVSIEMMEALGDRYLAPYFAQLHRLLKPQGLVGLQYITVPDCRHAALRQGVDFIQKHIFPGSLLLSITRVNQAAQQTGNLFLHDLKDLGSGYARTLHAWWLTFNSRREEVLALGFDARFLRKWNYYLQYCEAAFASRNITVVQAIYTRPNNPHLHEDFSR